MQKVKNYYEVLEIPVAATQDDIQSGYKRAKNAYSQDSLALYSLMTKDECQQILELIEEAYTILSDPLKRSQYNGARGLGEVAPEKNYQKSKENFDGEKTTPRVSESIQNGPMTKIVAAKRYQLEYEVDQKFEAEIENCSEFNGEMLRRVREYKNVDIKRLADMTKVSKTHLQNIESELFASLPAPVYVRGFVYQYAKCLKLNPELVSDTYLKKMKAQIEE